MKNMIGSLSEDDLIARFKAYDPTDEEIQSFYGSVLGYGDSLLDGSGSIHGEILPRGNRIISERDSRV